MDKIFALKIKLLNTEVSTEVKSLMCLIISKFGEEIFSKEEAQNYLPRFRTCFRELSRNNFITITNGGYKINI